ncbi:CopD family protein [Candidatus Pandoraea novymonadis]|uniref:Protoporphyrinogen IX oxidase n=1 Tax=Candidatus Pandoraea novymonadis TaxID=1808959 RepID=A0ABX5FHJ4_9BURK|nr:CopD family protein [Candidatus Pandoraea novymonadis]PSB92312.1 hypothetical protein BZL35_00552 [Candidatus Pandoraea novymonadis]
MFWIKAFHIVFVISWFAGLFYLPRFFVNLAMEKNQISKNRLLLMARKLYQFMTLLAVPALIFGLILWIYYGIGRASNWMHVKLLLVVLLLGYHHACGRLLRKFEAGGNTYSHQLYRYFNEFPVLVLLVVVILVVVKPF